MLFQVWNTNCDSCREDINCLETHLYVTINNTRYDFCQECYNELMDGLKGRGTTIAGNMQPWSFGFGCINTPSCPIPMMTEEPYLVDNTSRHYTGECEKKWSFEEHG